MRITQKLFSAVIGLSLLMIPVSAWAHDHDADGWHHEAREAHDQGLHRGWYKHGHYLPSYRYSGDGDGDEAYQPRNQREPDGDDYQAESPRPSWSRGYRGPSVMPGRSGSLYRSLEAQWQRYGRLYRRALRRGNRNTADYYRRQQEIVGTELANMRNSGAASVRYFPRSYNYPYGPYGYSPAAGMLGSLLQQFVPPGTVP